MGAVLAEITLGIKPTKLIAIFLLIEIGNKVKKLSVPIPGCAVFDLSDVSA